MSRDIRSYFSKSPASGAKSKQTETASPKSKKRARRVIESDDEGDDVFVQKKKSSDTAPDTKLLGSSKKKKDEKKPEVIVEVENFFGTKPVQQKRQVISTKKKKEEVEEKPPPKKRNKKTNGVKFEVSFESDDELEASFLQADEEQLLSKTETVDKTKVTPNKSKVEKAEVTPDQSTQTKSTPDKDKVKKTKGTPKKEPEKQIKTPKQEEKKAEQTSEQKRRNAEAYQKYLHRSGPKNPGSKTIPESTPTCLQGLTFVITGVLDSLEREEAADLIQKCGGRVTGSVSKKTDYVVVGEEPGASKIQKADGFGTKKINEDELLDLIREKSNGGKRKEKDFVEGTPEKKSKYFDKKEEKKAGGKGSPAKIPKLEKKNTPEKGPEKGSEPLAKGTENVDFKDMEKTGGDMLWVDKYKPKLTKNIVGQMGEKSNVKKLTKWLQNWHKNHSTKGGKKLARPAPWAQNDDGAYFKAALLSGPPGVGKTTSVHLVCKELGLDIIEFNASDTRSKRLLEEDVSMLLSSKSIREYFKGGGEVYEKHVLVMDEVDGMAGNEDRGGVQELIQLIKNTKVPIVGICNDRNHPKMRSLVNHCFELRYQRPRVEQIKAAMKSICFKEKLEISNEALEDLILASNHDLRQVLHNLSLLAAGHKPVSLEEAKQKSQQAKKPLNLGPWDVARKVFSASDQEKMSFTDKTDLFFQDYSLGPLFVQDTYLRVKPYKARNCKKKTLELLSNAAESLALGDTVEKTIRSQNAWGLLPLQAVFSSVAPGHYMSGHVQGQIQFPAWFGKNSRSNKFDRLLQDLHSSLKMNITGSKEAVNLDYLQHLKNAIIKPLINEGSQGVQKSLQFMLDYHLTREDLDSILELSAWPGVVDLFAGVDPKVKAALTKALNKESQSVLIAKKKTKSKGDGEILALEGAEVEVEDEDDDENENIDLDPMIKKGKQKAKKPTEEKGEKKDDKGKGSKKAAKKTKK